MKLNSKGKLEGKIALPPSRLVRRSAPEWSVYNATKAAVRSFARAWSIELKDRRIRVNAVSPGYTGTSSWHALPAAEKTMKTISGGIPLGRFGTPDEIARAVVFLASDDSSYVTGIVRSQHQT